MLDVAKTHDFDASAIAWRRLDWLDHIEFFVYNVDEANRIVDVIFKFAAGKRVMLHQHKADYVTFVVQGELHFFRPDGTPKEIRRAGSYVRGFADSEPHTEGGGPHEDAIVFFSNRNIEDALYDFLDEKGQSITVLGIGDFKAQYEAQEAEGANKRVATHVL